jgi:NADH:ubiquinone reductase (non-electrogenic)
MLFKMADKDNSGTLTLEEIRDVLEDIFIRYPQVELYMKNMHMLDIEDLIGGAIGDSHKDSMVVDIEEFKKALSHVDSQVKSAPATAQVLSVSIRITNIYQTLMTVNNQMINIC